VGYEANSLKNEVRQEIGDCQLFQEIEHLEVVLLFVEILIFKTF
jgi:hypothetical protein